jgi:hypothetical protein
MRERQVRITLVIVNFLEAASAFLGAVGLVVGFMNIPVSVLNGTPFTDFTVPAVLLGGVVGGSALVAAVVTAFASRWWGAVASAIAGCITVGWLTTEIAMIGLGSWAQIAYLLVGLLMIVLAGLLGKAEPRPAPAIRIHQPV